MNAQIKMFESIGVLVVFFFLLVIGAVFYFNVQQHSLHEELAKLAELKSIEVVERAFFLPELDCSFVGIQVPNCFDTTKILVLRDLLEDDDAARTDYFQTFGFAMINVREVYPGGFTSVVYENPSPTAGSSKKTQSPVLLYNATRGRYSFGIVEVVTYAD